MTQKQALEVLCKNRGDCIVVTTMSAVGIWPGLSDTPLDFAYLPSTMGQGPGLGLGLALAQPHACTGDTLDFIHPRNPKVNDLLYFSLRDLFTTTNNQLIILHCNNLISFLTGYLSC